MSYGYLGPKLDEIATPRWDNPVNWREYLDNHCEVRGMSEVCTYYGTVNCNYIVFKGRVIENYGFNGRVLFNLLQDTKSRKQWLRKVRQFNTTIYNLKRELSKESEIKQ